MYISMTMLKVRYIYILLWALSEKSAASSITIVKSRHYHISRQSKSLNDGKKEN